MLGKMQLVEAKHTESSLSGVTVKPRGDIGEVSKGFNTLRITEKSLRLIFLQLVSCSSAFLPQGVKDDMA